MTNTMLIYRGVPGSGKSTAALEFVRENETYARVNRDEIRFQLFGKWYGVDEVAVTKVQDAQIRAILGSKRDVLIDATNLRARNVKDVMKIAREFEATVEFRDFPISLQAAIARDIERAERGERSVGEAVIRSFFDRFIRNGGELPAIPTLEEDVIAEFKPYVPGRIDAYSFDVDGTLAEMVERGPYDTSLYHTDAVDEYVRDILWIAQETGYKIIVLSGRSAEFKEVLEGWLEAHGMNVDRIFMRAEGDMRNDAIVKSELVDKYISNVYDVRMHFDDRDRVVKALRAKGMKVAQVNYGNF